MERKDDRSMNKPILDRRIKRTRKLLQAALAELMTKKKFRDISVKDITDLADVNRSTFYLHYQDTYDLLRQIEDELIEQLRRDISQACTVSSPFTVRALVECVCDYLDENMQFCRPLFLSSANTPFWKKFMEIIREESSIMPPGYESESPLHEYQLTFLSYGLAGILQRRFEDPNPVPRQQMVDLLDRMINGVIQVQ